jgi:hypothetical protein
MITSTVTRPSRASIINPITTCERRVTFLDDIDISNLVKPKPRIVTLEPIIRRSRTRSRRRIPELPQSGVQSQHSSQAQPHQTSHLQSQAQAQANSLSSQTTTPTATPTPTQQSQQFQQQAPPIAESHARSSNTPAEITECPRSPGPSEDSFETNPSSGGAPSATESAVYSHSARNNDGRTPANPAITRALSRKPITTSVEINSAGFLRGDMIEIKVRISHTKHIKSLHGVIATLYRQARVDMHPELPLVHNKNDELYPKSRTGLSGLSLSSTGSCHLYRKDFDQSFASIIINPDTLAAEIKTSLRVPEDAFPTISTVPGAMISFKYYVEVILDIQGKLTALDKFLPTPNVSNFSSSVRNTQGMGTSGAHANMYAGWGGHSIDTEDIRREKSVVSCNFEVVIGSRDSKRVGRWKDQSVSALNTDSSVPNIVEPGSRSLSGNGTFSHSATHLDSMLAEPPLALRPRSATQEEFGPPIARHLQVPSRSLTLPSAHSPRDSAPDYQSSNPHPIHFPVPNIPHDSELDEKERIRRAEERLLPSQPPETDTNGESSSTYTSHLPSAPSAPDLVPLNRQYSAGGSSSRPSQFSLPFAPSSSHAPLAPPIHHSAFTRSENHLAPAYDVHHASHSSSSLITDDKQELERHRLEAERSAPPTAPGVSSIAAPSAPPGPSTPSAPDAPPAGHMNGDYAPTAPVLTDEDVLGFNEQTMNSELPKYER